VIEERADHIIKESSKVQDTLSSIEMQTDNLAEASKHVGVQINDVLLHSKSIFEQSKEIATAQAELGRGQAEMREKIEAGMARVEESYQTLGNGMDKLKQETGYIHKEIQSVGASMSSKMQHLQSTADDIGSAAGKSLENQMQLLNGQAQAMDGLNELHSFQAQALEESRCYCYYVHMYRSFCNVFLNIDKMLAARLTVIKKKMLTKLSMAGKQFRDLHSLASVSRRSCCPDKKRSGKPMSISSRILTPYWKHRFLYYPISKTYD
jgi:hypothetical protein